MKKLFWLAVVIAILAAFFASTNPDGLDSVAKKLGFAGKGIERSAPLATFLPAGGISAILAALAGILIILAVFWLAAFLFKRLH